MPESPLAVRQLHHALGHHPFERGVSRVERSLSRFERGVEKRMASFDRRFAQSARSVEMMKRAVLALGSGAAVNALRGYAEGWRQVQRALAAAGFEGENAQKLLIRVAMRTRSSVDQVALAAKRISRATGADLETTLRRVETLQKLMAVGGASQSQREAVLQQLPQALQAGSLQGDEFRSLRANAPVELMTALAESAGVGIQALKDVASQGKLTTAVVTDALDNLAETADRKFSKLAQTGDEAFVVLNNGMKALVGSIDSELGATEAFNAAIRDLGLFLAEASDEAEEFAEALRIAADLGAIWAASLGGAATVNAIGRVVVARRASLAAAIAENAAAQSNLELARADVAAKGASAAASNALAAAQTRAATATSALTAAQARLTVAGTAATVSMAALTRVLAFFGGPVGLAFTALAASVYALSYATGEASKKTGEIVEKYADLVSIENELTEKQRELEVATKAAGDAQDVASKVAIDALKDEIAILEKKLGKQRESIHLSRKELDADRAKLTARLAQIAGAEDRLKGRNRTDAAIGRILEERKHLLDSIRVIDEKIAGLDSPAPTGDGAGGATASGGSGKGTKKDKPPELQGPEYDPGAEFRDQLIEARDLLEENRTAEQKLARAKERLLALQPALVEAIRAEAYAHGQVITAAEAEAAAKAVIERANERLAESAETVEKAQREAMQEFARGLASTFRQADSLSDALDRIANQLLDMVLDDAFSTLFGGKASSPLGTIFGFLGSGLGALFGGGAGGGASAALNIGKFASGGLVRGSGTGTSDSIPARLSNGEFVVNARATRRALPLLDAINRGRLPAFAEGGLVTPTPAPIMAPPPTIGSSGAGGVSIVNNVSVTVDGGDDPKATGAAAAQAVRAVVQAEMGKSLRPGGVLDNALKGKR